MRQIFADNFGLISPTMRVDFKAFQEIIDEVGGVTVTMCRVLYRLRIPGTNFFLSHYFLEPSAYRR